MDKQFYRECLKTEIYGAGGGKSVLYNLMARIYKKHIYLPTNAVYLFRRMQYFSGKSGLFARGRTVLLKAKLAKKYGILASDHAQIDIGLRFVHPTSIVIGAHVVAGKNLSLYQNTTLGGRRTGDVKFGNQPVLGDNVTVFANSLVLGKVKIGDNVIVGANSLLLEEAPDDSIFAGSPAKRVK